MLKISSKASITLSIALSIMFLIGCIGGAFFMPYLVELLINTRDNVGFRDDITQVGRVIVHIFAYSALADAMLADCLLFSLLLRVCNGKVFSVKSVSLIRGVSWCCFLLGVVFCGLGIYFQLALIVAFAAVFLGICLRVVKNVIEEATEIKSENDLTV